MTEHPDNRIPLTPIRKRKAYSARAPKYAIYVNIDGLTFRSLGSWKDREYAEFKCQKIPGGTVRVKKAMKKV